MGHPFLSELFNRGIHLLLPTFCPLCQSRSDTFSIAPLCRACWLKIKPFHGYSCSICALPVESGDVHICGECLKSRPHFSRVITYGIYEDMLKEAIRLYKYTFIRRLAKPLSSLLLSLQIPEADAIVPVPLTKKRLIERGFNQSLLIARHLSENLNIPLAATLLEKTRETEHQSLLSRSRRLKSLKGAFRIRERIKDCRVIIVDDVLTTGTTLNECAKILIKGGAQDVFAVIVARTRP